MRRAIDIHEGDAIDTTAFKALIRAAVALNRAKSTHAEVVEGGGKSKRN